jgi:hypothetical protein
LRVRGASKSEEEESEKSSGPADARWWSESQEKRRGELVCTVAGRVYQQLQPVRMAMFRYGNNYEELPWSITTPRGYTRRRIANVAPLAWNVTKSVCDSYVAQVTQDLPKTSVETIGGNRDLQRKAKTCEKLIAGIKNECNYYSLLTEAAFDSCKFGQGILKIFRSQLDPASTPKVGMERALPWDVLVGDQDGMFRKPRSYFHLRPIERSHLQDLFPKQADELGKAKTRQFDAMGASSDAGGPTIDMVMTVEAWHLPLYEGGPGGMRCYAVGPLILGEPEEYTHEFSPFVWLYRQLPTLGMYAKSLCQEGAGLQKAINRLGRDCTKHEAMVIGHWLVELNSKVNTAGLNDQTGIVTYEGTRPTYEAPSPNSPTIYAQFDRLVNAFYELPGISRLAASSQKPAGLDSGEAIRTYADVTTQRFKPSYQLLQQFDAQVGRQVLSLARDIAEENPSYEVMALGRGAFSLVKASETLLKEGDFRIRIAETNALADEPSSKLQEIAEMEAEGTLTPFTARRLKEDVPDLEAEMKRENSSYNLSEKRIAAILDGAPYEPPDPMMQLDDLPDGSPGAIRQAQLACLEAENDNVEPERVALLQRWVVQAQGLVPPPPQAPPQFSTPGGAPMPPPGAVPGGAPVPAQPPQQAA